MIHTQTTQPSNSRQYRTNPNTPRPISNRSMTDRPQPETQSPLSGGQNLQPLPPPNWIDEKGRIRNPITELTALSKGVAGAVIGGTVGGFSGLVAGAVQAPAVTYEAVVGTWNSEMLGPILKTTLTPAIVAAGLAAPAVAAVAATGYGLAKGFAAGVQDGPLAGACQLETFERVQEVNQNLIEGIRDAASVKPGSAGEVFEFNLADAGRSLVGAAAGAAIQGLGTPLSLAWHMPRHYGEMTEKLWDSDHSVPVKIGEQFLLSAAFAVALPLATAEGALCGLGQGAALGYQHGVGESIEGAFGTLKEVNKSISEINI